MSDQLFDVLSVRTLDNGGKVKAIIAGPYSRVEADYQAQRLKEEQSEQYEYQVVEHHVCPACNGEVDAIHTCTMYLRSL